jgi:hypothetical protein
MRCFICDVAIAEPSFNSDHDDYEPCSYCQEIIKDAIGADKASADEDELGDESYPLQQGLTHEDTFEE